MRLLLRTLGSLELVLTETGGRTHTIPAGGKSLALLTYLCCAPKRTASRERLADLLWADAPTESALGSLRQARLALRKLADREIVTVHGSELTLSLDVHCDRDQFRSWISSGKTADAVHVYVGPFCEGFAAAGAEDFERWAERERASLRSLCVEAIAKLASTALAEARATDALRLAVRLGEVDGQEERSWRYRLDALLLKQDSLGARVTASECRIWLNAEEVEPSRALQQLLDRVDHPVGDDVDHVMPSDHLPVLRPELVGREIPFAAILTAWKQAGSGRPSSIVLVGPPGHGKTRLLGAVRERLLAGRARVASVRALPAESGIRYALVSRLAAELASLRGAAGLSERSAAVLVGLNSALAAHFRSASAVQAPSDATLAYLEALDELLTVVGEDSRLAVFVDDLHWADQESAQILASLGERLSSGRLLLVLAMRGRLVAGLRTPSSALTLRLEALSEVETGHLMASLAALPEPAGTPLSLVLHRASKGSPLLILETLRHAMDAEWLAIGPSGWQVLDEVSVSALPARQSALNDRLDRLDTPARLLALILAVAGRPLSETLLTGDTVPASDIAATMQLLEVRDIAIRDENGWAISHDALAEALVASSTPEQLVTARTITARALASAVDLHTLRSALHLFVGLERWSECAELVLRIAHLGGVHGGSSHTRAQAILSEIYLPSARSCIRQRLPVSVRLPVRRLAAAALTMLAGVLTAVAATRANDRSGDHRDVTLLVYGRSIVGVVEARAIPLQEGSWMTATTLDLSQSEPIASLPASIVAPDAVHPIDGSAAIERFYDDSGQVDVALWSSNGPEKRLTFSPGDDVPTGWSPDGATLLIESSREGQLGHRAIMGIDIASGRVRRISTGGTRETSDAHGRWSPDGSRVAFVRKFYSLRPAELCTVHGDGAEERCHKVVGRSIRNLGGWSSVDRLLVNTDSAGVHRAEYVSLRDLPGRTIGSAPGESWLSPDRRWIAQRRDDVMTIAPAANPEWRRRILLPARSTVESVRWQRSGADDLMIHRVRIAPPMRALPVGVGTRLEARALNEKGIQIDGVALRWSLVDPARGTIHDGLLVPSSPGTIRVRVSAGGWRSAEIDVLAVDATGAIAAREDWDADVEKRWRFFGEPAPTVVNVAGRASFWNRGDGDHFSGAYTRAVFPSRSGLWVEADVSTPITATQWQLAMVIIEGAEHRRALDTWNHRSGAMPVGGSSSCQFVYPHGEGLSGLRRIGGGGDISRTLGYPTDSLARGGWYRVLIQLFPDARCGIALDGVPVHLGDSSGPMPDSAHVVLKGSSYGTRILVGALSVGTGVRRDVPWATLDGSASR